MVPAPPLPHFFELPHSLCVGDRVADAEAENGAGLTNELNQTANHSKVHH